MYDLIGDIHGHAAALERLLGLLGYSRHGGVHRHPSRQVIFLGDFIDRGPAIRETLAIVRAMVEAGTARAVMGNHELNALAFHTPDPHAPGEHLRRHNEMHSRQHAETVRQLPGAQLTDALDWFRTLPLWLDLDGFRVVHACWDEMLAARVADHLGERPVTDDFLLAACHRDGPLFRPVETLLKARDLARAAGLRYVYIGNVPGLAGAGNTSCPTCHRTVIERDIFSVTRLDLNAGKCRHCHTAIAGVWS